MKRWIANLITDERLRQDEERGPIRDRTHPFTVWLAALTEEVGEVSSAILHRDQESLQDELVHVAAVAVAMLEDLDMQWDDANFGVEEKDAG